MRRSTLKRVWSAGFTLVELLVSMVVLSIIMAVSASFVTQTQKAWTQSSARTEQFREARMAFETITRGLRQATLNTYMTYQYNTGADPTVPSSPLEAPSGYVRQSELQFVTGKASDLLLSPSEGDLGTHAIFFQAAMGVSERDGYEALNRLLCARGYFILKSDDNAFRPPHVSQSRERFRLWEFRPPAERNGVYSTTGNDWFNSAASQTIKASEDADSPSYSRPAAENIIALIISPRVTPEDAALMAQKSTWIAPNYAYDSISVANTSSSRPQGTQHLLPPLMQVTLVAIDEVSAAKLAEETDGADLVESGAFANCANYETDLAALEASLVARKVNYRVFSSTIPMRNSKWGLLVK